MYPAREKTEKRTKKIEDKNALCNMDTQGESIKDQSYILTTIKNKEWIWTVYIMRRTNNMGNQTNGVASQALLEAGQTEYQEDRWNRAFAEADWNALS